MDAGGRTPDTPSDDEMLHADGALRPSPLGQDPTYSAAINAAPTDHDYAPLPQVAHRSQLYEAKSLS